jgi:hypothetical protein
MPVPITEPPSLKVTVPVAVTGSVAVKVTEVPVLDGFREEERAMVGVAMLMTKLPAETPARLL